MTRFRLQKAFRRRFKAMRNGVGGVNVSFDYGCKNHRASFVQLLPKTETRCPCSLYSLSVATTMHHEQLDTHYITK